MSLCPDLATKQELASLERQINKELERKIPTKEKDSIVNDGGLKGKSLVVGSIALIGGTANNALSKANQAWSGLNQALGNADNAYQVAKSAQSTANNNTSNISNVRSNVRSNATNIGKVHSEALNAKLTAKKANYQSLYNASKTASNANKIASVGGQALKALNLVGTVYSVLSTFATTAALAYLTKKVAALNNAVIRNRQQIERNRIRSVENALINGRQQSEIDQINQANRIRDIQHKELAYRHGLQQAQIVKNTTDIANFKASTKQQIESLKRQYQKQIDSLTESNSELQKQITQANNDIQQVNSQIQSTNLNLQSLKQQNNSQVTNDTQKLIEKTVKKEVNQNVRIRNLNDKVTNYDLNLHTLKSNSKVLESSIEARNREVIKHAKDLERRVNEIKNNEIETNNKVDNLGRQVIQKNNQVDQKQVQDINLKLDNLDNKVSNFPSPTTIAFAVGGLDILRQINENSSKSSCQAPTLVPPIGTSVTNLQALNTAQNIGIQNTVNTINKTVSHGTHGLEAIKKAADVAWKATHADKALQMLNTVVVISNAMALGTNIVDTVGDTASLVLSSLGIKDSTGQAINVNQVIGNTVKNWIVGIVGQANYVAYEQKIKSRLRTYQAAANLYSSVRNMFASAEDIAEETGINVAQIGNALRDSNTVETDSYGYMPEGKRRINSIFNALEHADDKADSLNRIARDVADITDEAVEFIKDRIEFKNLLLNEKKLEIRNEERETNRIESLPNIEEKDKLETVDESS